MWRCAFAAGETLNTETTATLERPAQAVGIIGMVAYFSYLAGDTLGLSGIVALFCCAVTMSHYAMHNITRQQRAATMSAFETLSFLSEGSIFVYVGLDALDPIKWKVCALGLLFLFRRLLRPVPCPACMNLHILVSWQRHERVG